jgi:hypothetical protein
MGLPCSQGCWSISRKFGWLERSDVSAKGKPPAQATNAATKPPTSSRDTYGGIDKLKLFNCRGRKIIVTAPIKKPRLTAGLQD